MSTSAGAIAADEVAARIAAGESAAAAQVVSTLARHTPVLSSRSLSERCGGRLLLKAENLQRTGSFKLRGAVHKISRLTDPPGVVAGSAGNHGQSLAYAARAQGIPCEVFMPREAPGGQGGGGRGLRRHRAPRGRLGGRVRRRRARARAQETGAGFVHPFDDPDIILGQSTLGLELLEDVPDLEQVVVPVGGGGLISGVAGVIKARHPGAKIVGVQVDACAPFPESLRGSAPITFSARATIADGIAIKRPGDITLPLVHRWVDDMVVVSEEDIADAMVWLLERSKLVVEGGGAAGVAAVLAERVSPAPRGATVIVLSGGNVDAGMLAAVAQRNETLKGRRMRLFTRISDRPGGLAALLTLIAEAGGNVVHADHVRDAVSLHVRETGVEITLETRNPQHCRRHRGRASGRGLRGPAPRW